MSILGRCRLYGLLWWVAALILAARARPYFGEGAGALGLSGQDAAIAGGAALIVGVGKGVSVMRRAAERARSRIMRRGATAPPWSIFEPGVVLLIVGMMGLGMAIRLAPYPEHYRPWVVGITYPAVALALLIGSAPLLKAPRPPPWAGRVR